MEAFDRMKQAQAILKEDGILVSDRFGQQKAHPLTTVERDCRSAIIVGYKALGLDLDNDSI
jgi:phage terminase small subunit